MLQTIILHCLSKCNQNASEIATCKTLSLSACVACTSHTCVWVQHYLPVVKMNLLAYESLSAVLENLWLDSSSDLHTSLLKGAIGNCRLYRIEGNFQPCNCVESALYFTCILVEFSSCLSQFYMWCIRQIKYSLTCCPLWDWLFHCLCNYFTLKWKLQLNIFQINWSFFHGGEQELFILSRQN